MLESSFAEYMPPSLSKSAQIGLTSQLLELKSFSNPKIQRRIASYPFENYQKKTELICEIMELLWPFHNSKARFETYRNFEIFLTASGKRGHFIHQFEVFLLGINILLSLWKRTDPDDRVKVFLVRREQDLINSWLFTSTMHDFGYPLQVAAKIMSDLALLYKGLDMTLLYDKYSSVKFEDILAKEHGLRWIQIDGDETDHFKSFFSVDSFIKYSIALSLNIDIKEASSVLELILKDKSNNHGYVSAAILCRAGLSNTSRARTEKSYREQLTYAVGAVALHGLGPSNIDIVRKLNFANNPYAYLLFIIDNIQDWGRAIVPNPDYADYQLSDIKFEPNVATISYIMRHDAWTEDLLTSTRKSIDEKRTLLSSLEPCTPNFDYEVNVNFKASDKESTEFGNINIAL